jgi:type II secretory pathway component GspD/PulD (secretin)
MNKHLKTLLISLLSIAISSQALAQNIKIKAKGDDLRQVIASVFEQTKEQYVLETNLHQTLFMSLENISFEKAVDILSNVADLKFEKKQGIWYINRNHKVFTPTAKNTNPEQPTKVEVKYSNTPATAPKMSSKAETTTKVAIQTGTRSNEAAKKSGTAAQSFVPVTVNTSTSQANLSANLSAKLSTRLQKTDIRDVFDEFSRQTKVEIVVDASVPNYKIDAYMFNTSLRFALDRVCKAAGLTYRVAGKMIQITKE